MIEMQKNLWTKHDQEEWIVITTNGFVKKDGCAVMGKGCAKEARKKYVSFPYELGQRIKERGNKVFIFDHWKIITFPVKHNWWEKADIDLIERSAKDLKIIVDRLLEPGARIFIPRPGCGNGQLKWNDVRERLKDIWNDDRFVVVDLPS